MTSAFNQLDQTVQTNASTSEEVAASAEEMSAQALNMKGTVEQLIGIVDGGGKGQVIETSASAAAPVAPAVSPKSLKTKAPAAKASAAVKPTKSKPKGETVTSLAEPPSEAVASAEATKNVGHAATTDDDFWNELPKMKRSA